MKSTFIETINKNAHTGFCPVSVTALEEDRL